MKEGAKYHVLPIDDRGIERINAALAGRPDLMAGRTSLTVFEGMTGMTENVFINVKNRSHTITAEVEIPERGGEGVILCQAGRFGGWSLYLKGGKPTYTYNLLGLERFTVAAAEAVPAGKATIQFAFASDGGKPGAGGTGTILVNGKKVAEGRIDRTQVLLLGRRGGRRGRRRGHAGHRRLQGARQPVHRQDQQGDGRAEVTRGRIWRRTLRVTRSDHELAQHREDVLERDRGAQEGDHRDQGGHEQHDHRLLVEGMSSIWSTRS